MRDLKIYFIVATIFLAIYLVIQYNTPLPVNWKESFSKEDKIPFGTYIIYNQLHDIFPKAEITSSRTPSYLTLKENRTNSTAYLIVAPTLKMDQYDFLELKKYMEKGNDVFIASYYLSEYIEDSLKTSIKTYKDAAAVKFVNAALDSSKSYSFDKGIGDQYFSSFDTSRAVILGLNNKGKAIFIKYPYGKGNLYLLSSPYFFSNYNLLNPGGAEFASKALSYLRPAQKVIWDEISALGALEEGGMMRVFFQFKQLRWAYYTALFGMAFFVAYQVKRKQRIIPVIEPLKNSSADFVTVVGQVYYERRDNANIARKKVTYFLEDVRTRYNIKTNKLDNEFANLLMNKSGVEAGLVNDLLRQFAQIGKFVRVTDTELIDLNKNIELFQQQSR